MIIEFFINIPAVLSNIYFVKLQKKLSISVPLQVVNLVGRVIWGEETKRGKSETQSRNNKDPVYARLPLSLLSNTDLQ